MLSILLRLVPGALLLLVVGAATLVQWRMSTPPGPYVSPSVMHAVDVMDHGPPDAMLPDVDMPHGDGEPIEDPRRLVSDLVAAKIALAMPAAVPAIGAMPLDALTDTASPPMPKTPPEPRPERNRKRKAVVAAPPPVPAPQPLPRDHSDTPGPRWVTYLVRAKPANDEPWNRRAFGGQ